MSEKKVEIELTEISEKMPMATTYWSVRSQKDVERKIQIMRMDVTCVHCSNVYTMSDKYIDILNGNEGWTGRCPECCTMNVIEIEIVDERARLASESLKVRLKAKAEGTEMPMIEWERVVEKDDEWRKDGNK